MGSLTLCFLIIYLFIVLLDMPNGMPKNFYDFVADNMKSIR